MLQEALTKRDTVFSLLRSLGLLVAPHKGQHQPSQLLVDHLGYCVDSERGLFLLTPKREAKLAEGAHALIPEALNHRRLVRPRQLESFAVLAQASYLALPLGRFHNDLSQRPPWRSRRKVRLSRQSIADLRTSSECHVDRDK